MTRAGGVHSQFGQRGCRRLEPIPEDGSISLIILNALTCRFSCSSAFRLSAGRMRCLNSDFRDRDHPCESTV